MFIRNERSIKEFIQLYPVVSTLIGINLALFVLINLLHLPFAVELRQAWVGFNPAISAGQYWRLVTPIFLHGGLMHVLFNSFSLVLFAPALEQMLGKFKFTLVFLLTGIVGNLGTYIMDPDSIVPHLGASGAIYGIFGVYIYMVVMRKDLIDPSSTQIIMIILIIGLVMTFLRGHVNASAHVFGFIGGVAIAPLFLSGVSSYSPWQRPRHQKHVNSSGVQFDPNRWQKKHTNKQRLKIGLWIAFGILVLIGLLNQIGLM